MKTVAILAFILSETGNWGNDEICLTIWLIREAKQRDQLGSQCLTTQVREDGGLAGWEQWLETRRK